MVIGITGGYCTGKTLVTNIFKKFGAKIIDLDKLAHKTLNPESSCFKKIIKEFGKDILVDDCIDRLRLAEKVFGNKKRLAKLNSIIHPVVIREMVNLIKRFSKQFKIITVEAPLLFEAKIKKCFDYVVVVKAKKNIQIERAMKSKGLNKRDVLRRINSQLPISEKIKQAGFVIDNNGSIKEIQRQIKEVLEKLKEEV